MIDAATRIDRDLVDQSDILASQLAEQLRASQPRKGPFPIPARLKKLKQFFQTAYNFFDQATQTQASVSNASEWLLDNFYVLEQALQVLEDDLPAEYYARLPKIQTGIPRVYLIALAINRETPRLDVEQSKEFVHSFQKITPLQVGEVWALPLMLRLFAVKGRLTLLDRRTSWISCAGISRTKREIELRVSLPYKRRTSA